jgi:hypothetical protein
MTTVSPGRYRHYKGDEYTVLGVALHSEHSGLLQGTVQVGEAGVEPTS